LRAEQALAAVEPLAMRLVRSPNAVQAELPLETVNVSVTPSSNLADVTGLFIALLVLAHGVEWVRKIQRLDLTLKGMQSRVAAFEPVYFVKEISSIDAVAFRVAVPYVGRNWTRL